MLRTTYVKTLRRTEVLQKFFFSFFDEHNMVNTQRALVVSSVIKTSLNAKLPTTKNVTAQVKTE